MKHVAHGHAYQSLEAKIARASVTSQAAWHRSFLFSKACPRVRACTCTCNMLLLGGKYKHKTRHARKSTITLSSRIESAHLAFTRISQHVCRSAELIAPSAAVNCVISAAIRARILVLATSTCGCRVWWKCSMST